MKKTLIALAALAVAGTAFAQSVTLSGAYGVSFQKATDGVKGVATTDGSLAVAATEDLGGGLTVTAKAAMDLQGRGQGTPVSTDASLTVAGGFGSLMAGSVEAGNGIIGRGMAGAPVTLPSGLDGLVLSGASNVDIVKWTSPAMNGFTVNASYTDLAGAGSQTRAQSTGAGFGYDNGPVSVSGDYTSYSKTDGYNGATATTGAKGADSRIRLSASYDLGVAKVGAGYQSVTYTDNAKNLQSVVGVSVPMGALTLGVAMARNNQEYGALQTVAQKSATVYAANYALSKRTSLNFSAANAPKQGTATSAKESQYRVRMLHTF